MTGYDLKVGDYIKILDKNATVTGEPVGTLLEICVLYKDHFRKEILRFETNSIINPNEKFIFDKNMIENGLIDYITKEEFISRKMVKEKINKKVIELAKDIYIASAASEHGQHTPLRAIVLAEEFYEEVKKHIWHLR